MKAKYPTLQEFWNQQSGQRSTDVRAPDFVRLYVRKGKRYLRLRERNKTGSIHRQYCWVDNLLQIANVMARNLGHGAFRKLVEQAEHQLHCNLFVENVFSDKFAEGLVRMGFVRLASGEEGSPPCFLKLLDGQDCK